MDVSEGGVVDAEGYKSVGHSIKKGGGKMPLGYGKGLVFRGFSPAWPYMGSGRGGLPRCGAPELRESPGVNTVVSSPEEAREFLRSEAEMMQSELNRIEAKIHDMEVSK